MPAPMNNPFLAGQPFGGSGAGAGFLGSIGNFLQMSNPLMAGLTALGGFFGGGGGNAASQQNLDRSRGDIMGLAGMQGPIGFNTGMGMTGATGFRPNQMFRGQTGMLGAVSPLLLQGGMFGDLGFQQALQGNDMAGALGQANQAFGQQMGAGTEGLGAMTGLFGSAIPGLLGSGLMNQMMAGDQSGLQSQQLAALRAQAQPEQNRVFNRLQDRLFAQGRLGSTGGADELRVMLESQNQQDLGFQTEAFNRAMQQQQFLGNLGFQQAQQAGGFGQQAAGLIGQGFGQNLQSLQQNQAAGLQRLQAAQGLFGQGVDTFASQFGLGLGGQEAMLGFGDLGLRAGMAPWQLQAGLLQGSGTHAGALADIGTAPVSSGGGFLGGLFSDRRLKKNIELVGVFNGFKWYSWDWNEKAAELGIDKQINHGVMADEVEKILPEAVHTCDNGYKQVDYNLIIGA